MKRISYLLFLSFLISLISTSCSNTKTYAQQLDDEQALITAYIKRQNINVLSVLPAKDAIWGANDYYKSGSGLYFHLIDSGMRNDTTTLQLKNTVVPRFKQFALTINPDTISNWNTVDFPYPNTFIYGDLSQSCKGFQEAVSYMRKNDSQAMLIVPSTLGFQADLNSVTPYGYLIKIKFLK
jgi:hypothetical protein